MRRRKVTYPPPKTATSGGSSSPAADARALANANRAVTINLEAMVGRPSIVQGARVQILGARIRPGDFAYADEDGVVFSQHRLKD